MCEAISVCTIQTQLIPEAYYQRNSFPSKDSRKCPFEVGERRVFAYQFPTKTTSLGHHSRVFSDDALHLRDNSDSSGIYDRVWDLSPPSNSIEAETPSPQTDHNSFAIDREVGFIDTSELGSQGSAPRWDDFEDDTRERREGPTTFKIFSRVSCFK
jgi:hypothetical protein